MVRSAADFTVKPAERIEAEGAAKLSAFGGVFAPSILTILGIIFYLRTGYVVGQVGLIDALIIISLAYTISILTSLSLAAVATSMRVKGGGFYYVISRTLGIEFGGALGLVLFLSVSIGIAFYAIGLGEVVVDMPVVPDWVTPRMVAVVVILALFGFAWAGADVATQLQYVVMAIVFASILAIGWGGIGGFDASQAAENTGALFSSEGGDMGFWAAFALFFPAITGFTQGLNMSGDLKKPTRDIPVGTLAAVVLSYGLYMGLAVILAGNVSGERLREDYLILEAIAPFAWIVTAGVLAATASSAMASFLGAPRIAQALGKDNVFPGSTVFAKGAGESDNPRRAVMLSGAIALGAVGIGNLNFLAPIITMFFLASYALLNYATFFVAHAASPSFRPTFRAFHKYLSLAGGLACVGAMVAIDVAASVVAVLSMIAIHQYLQGRGDKAIWADSKRAYGFQRIREQLFELERRPAHPQDWRPQILVLSKDEERRRELLCFSAWIEGESGLTSLVSVIEEDAGDRRDPGEVERDLAEWIDRSEVQAFPLVVKAPTFRTGFSVLLQAYGVGPLKANTLLLNWLEQVPPRQEEQSKRVYGSNLEAAIAENFNIVVLGAHEGIIPALEETPGHERRVDIWWCSGATGDLMLLLGYLMTRMPDWEQSKLRVLAEGRSGRPERTRETIEDMLEEVRIFADVEILDHIDRGTVRKASADAALTYFPLIIEDQKPQARFGIEIDVIAEDLPLVALCIAGEDIELASDPDDIAEEEEAKVERKQGEGD